jgi:hypothetical protein
VLCVGVQAAQLGYKLDAAPAVVLSGLPWSFSAPSQFEAGWPPLVRGAHFAEARGLDRPRSARLAGPDAPAKLESVRVALGVEVAHGELEWAAGRVEVEPVDP